jgi:hypothetical protein
VVPLNFQIYDKSTRLQPDKSVVYAELKTLESPERLGWVSYIPGIKKKGKPNTPLPPHTATRRYPILKHVMSHGAAHAGCGRNHDSEVQSRGPALLPRSALTYAMCVIV